MGSSSGGGQEMTFSRQFKLIAHHQRAHKKLALTLPFLLCALREPPERPFTNEPSAQAGLLALLLQLGDETPESHFTHIYHCPTLKQPVVSITSSFYLPSYAAWGIQLLAGTRLHIDATYKDPNETIEKAAARLWQELKAPLMEGRFSFCEGAYRAFDESEKTFIAFALSYEEDNEL
jgi:hypothetical protein